jgi:23S rRNA (cytidine1920-2'-O)/16S rRNA (cytidine1409-2'-O)-methyltransferase
LIVSDVSFISLEFVIPKVYEFLSSAKSDAVLLIKPQFELGHSIMKKTTNGVITDENLLSAAVEKVHNIAVKCGFQVMDTIPCSITGEYGNQEYLLHLKKNRLT